MKFVTNWAIFAIIEGFRQLPLQAAFTETLRGCSEGFLCRSRVACDSTHVETDVKKALEQRISTELNGITVGAAGIVEHLVVAAVPAASNPIAIGYLLLCYFLARGAQRSEQPSTIAPRMMKPRRAGRRPLGGLRAAGSRLHQRKPIPPRGMSDNLDYDV